MKADILHQDISPGNLLVLVDNPSIGLLSDFDLARKLGDLGGNLFAGGEFSVPFLSLAHELCRLAPPPHEFWHDLQSIYWTVRWVLSRFRCGHRIKTPVLDTLFSGSLRQLAQSKTRLVKELPFEYQFESATEDFVAAFGRNEDPAPLQACLRMWHLAMPFTSDRDYILMRDSLDVAIKQYGFM
jgi:hypothetical protein